MGIIKNTIKDVTDFVGLDAQKAKAYFLAGGNPIKAKFIYDKIKSSGNIQLDGASSIGADKSQLSSAVQYARNPKAIESSLAEKSMSRTASSPILSKIQSEKTFKDMMDSERNKDVFAIDDMKKLGKIKNINIMSNRKNNIFGLFDMFTIPMDQTMFGRNMFRKPEEVLTEKGKRYSAIHYTTMLLEHILEVNESALPVKGSYMERFFQMDENRFMANLRGSFLGQVWMGIRDKIQDVFDVTAYAMKGVRGFRNIFKIGKVKQTWTYSKELGLDKNLTTQQKNIQILEGVYSAIRAQTEMFKDGFKLGKNDYLPFTKTKVKFSLFGKDFFKENINAYDEDTGEFTKNTAGRGIVGAGLNFTKEDIKKSDLYKDYISKIVTLPGDLRDEILKNMNSMKESFSDTSFSDSIFKAIGRGGKSAMKYLSSDIKQITDKNYRGGASVVSDADIVKPTGTLPKINPKKYSDAIVREIKATAPKDRIGDLVGSFKNLSGKILDTKGLTNKEKYMKLVDLSNSFTGAIPVSSNVVEEEKPKSPLSMIQNLLGFGGAAGGGSLFGGVLDKVSSLGSTALGAVGGAAGGLVKTAGGAAGGLAKKAGGAVGGLAKKAGGAAVGLAKKAGGGLATMLGKLGGMLGKGGKAIVNGLIKIGKPIFSFIGKAGAAMAPYVLPILGVAGAAFVGYKIGTLISDKVFGAFDKIGDFFSSGIIKGGEYIEKKFGAGSIPFLISKTLGKLLGVDIKDEKEREIERLGGAKYISEKDITKTAIKTRGSFRKDIVGNVLTNPEDIDIGVWFTKYDKSDLNLLLKGFDKVANEKYKSGDEGVDLWNKYKYYSEVIEYMKSSNPDLLTRKWNVLGKGKMTMEQYLISKQLGYRGKLSRLSKKYGYGKDSDSLEKFVDDKKTDNIMTFAKSKASDIKDKGSDVLNKIKNISEEEFKKLPRETQKKILSAMNQFSGGASDLKDITSDSIDKVIDSYNSLKMKVESKMNEINTSKDSKITEDLKGMINKMSQVITNGITNLTNNSTTNIANNNQQVNPSDSVMERLDGNTVNIMNGKGDTDTVFES